MGSTWYVGFVSSGQYTRYMEMESFFERTSYYTLNFIWLLGLNLFFRLALAIVYKLPLQRTNGNP